MARVCIVGLGYIGLPTAIVAAQHGLSVTGFDIDRERVARINNGDPVIKEPEVAEQLVQAVASGNFTASTAVVPADFFIIAVPTPFKEEKKADLSYVWRAIMTILPVLQRGNVIIIESTVPVGTTEQVAAFLQSKTGWAVGDDFFVAYCPERVLPGNILYELVHNPRIIGGVDEASLTPVKNFYKHFVKGELYLTSATAAEMVKLVENSSRDVAIAFANQIASIAYSLGLNPFEIIELANKHPRVSILNPSCGVGGHCIAVDPWFLVESFPEHTKLLKSSRMVNDEKPLQVVAAIRAAVGQWKKRHAGDPAVLVLGLTYKANVDDLRESPALAIAKKLSKYSDMSLLVCDPYAPRDVIASNFDTPCSLADGLQRADIIACLVCHQEFKQLGSSVRVDQIVLDFCGLLHTPKMAAQEMLFWPARIHSGIPGHTFFTANSSAREQERIT
jgi:UDP-N-acetyl-D-mannosaminuronic acid dehydrogenase